MNLNYSETNFTKVEDVVIPDSFYTRVKTNNKIIDDLFSGGLIPGTTFSLFSKQGYGKCQGPNEKIKIYANKKVINKIKEFLAI